MKLMRTLALGAALAVPVSAIYVATADTAVEAKGKKKASKKKVKKVAWKNCGTMKYWKAGKCLDATAKKK